MNAVLEQRPVEAPETDEQEATAELVVHTRDDLPDLVRRCRELLARATPPRCPPGHWLG